MRSCLLRSSAAPAQLTTCCCSWLQGRIQGFGSDAAGGSGNGGGMMAFGSDSGGYGSGSGSRGGRMVGFGSADVSSQVGGAGAVQGVFCAGLDEQGHGAVSGCGAQVALPKGTTDSRCDLRVRCPSECNC